MQSSSQVVTGFPLDTQNVSDLYHQLKFYGMALFLLNEKGGPAVVDMNDDNSQHEQTLVLELANLDLTLLTAEVNKITDLLKQAAEENPIIDGILATYYPFSEKFVDKGTKKYVTTIANFSELKQQRQDWGLAKILEQSIGAKLGTAHDATGKEVKVSGAEREQAEEDAIEAFLKQHEKDLRDHAEIENAESVKWVYEVLKLRSKLQGIQIALTDFKKKQDHLESRTATGALLGPLSQNLRDMSEVLENEKVAREQYQAAHPTQNNEAKTEQKWAETAAAEKLKNLIKSEIVNLAANGIKKQQLKKNKVSFNEDVIKQHVKPNKINEAIFWLHLYNKCKQSPISAENFAKFEAQYKAFKARQTAIDQIDKIAITVAQNNLLTPRVQQSENIVERSAKAARKAAAAARRALARQKKHTGHTVAHSQASRPKLPAATRNLLRTPSVKKIEETKTVTSKEEKKPDVVTVAPVKVVTATSTEAAPVVVVPVPVPVPVTVASVALADAVPVVTTEATPVSVPVASASLAEAVPAAPTETATVEATIIQPATPTADVKAASTSTATEQKTTQPNTAVANVLNHVYSNNGKKTTEDYHHADPYRKPLLDKLLDKLYELHRRGQHDRISSLYEIYKAFLNVDLSNPDSIKEFYATVDSQKNNIDRFSSDLGKFGAAIKQTFFSTGYDTTTNLTRQLVDDTVKFVQRNAGENSFNITLTAYRLNPQYHQGIKKDMLDEVMKEMIQLSKRKGTKENDKLMSLFEIYRAFKDVDLSDAKSVEACRKTIIDKLPIIKSFNSKTEKMKASISQAFDNKGYGVTTNETRIVVDKLLDFFERNARLMKPTY